MQSSTLSDWLEGFESDRPVSDGAWANGWSPVWEDAASVRSGEPASAKASAMDEKQMEGMSHNG